MAAAESHMFEDSFCKMTIFDKVHAPQAIEYEHDTPCPKTYDPKKEGFSEQPLELKGPNGKMYTVPNWMPCEQKIRDYYADCKEMVDEHGDVNAKDLFLYLATRDLTLTEGWIQSRVYGLRGMYRDRKRLMDSIGRLHSLPSPPPDSISEANVILSNMGETIVEFQDELRHFRKHKDLLEQWVGALSGCFENIDSCVMEHSECHAKRPPSSNSASGSSSQQPTPSQSPVRTSSIALSERKQAIRFAKKRELEDQRRRAKELYAEREREAQEALEKERFRERLNLWCRRHRIEQKQKKEQAETAAAKRVREERLKTERAQRDALCVQSHFSSSSVCATTQPCASNARHRALTQAEKAHRDGFSNRCKEAISRDFYIRQDVERDGATERRRLETIQRVRDREMRRSKAEAVRTQARPQGAMIASIIEDALSQKPKQTKQTEIPMAKTVSVELGAGLGLGLYPGLPIVQGRGL